MTLDVEAFQAIEKENGNMLIFQQYKDYVNGTTDIQDQVKNWTQHQKRGKKRGYSKRYVCSGIWKDPKDMDVGPYTNKPTTKEAEIASCKKRIL